MLNETVSLNHAHPLDLVIMAVSPNCKPFPKSLLLAYLFIICPNLLCEHFSLILPHGYAYWWFIPWFVSCFRLWRKDLSINRMNRQPSPATPHNSIYLLYIFQLKPFRTFIWNHALELLKITRHIERDTVPTPLPSKLLWLKMTFLDQNISKSNSETAILLLMEKVETL